METSDIVKLGLIGIVGIVVHYVQKRKKKNKPPITFERDTCPACGHCPINWLELGRSFHCTACGHEGGQAYQRSAEWNPTCSSCDTTNVQKLDVGYKVYRCRNCEYEGGDEFDQYQEALRQAKRRSEREASGITNEAAIYDSLAMGQKNHSQCAVEFDSLSKVLRKSTYQKENIIVIVDEIAKLSILADQHCRDAAAVSPKAELQALVLGIDSNYFLQLESAVFELSMPIGKSGAHAYVSQLGVVKEIVPLYRDRLVQRSIWLDSCLKGMKKLPNCMG